MIDLRSDTVTEPTDEMRREMGAAPVGDDVFGEDPTVAALERECAEILGYPASLFVPSGTMGNQIAIRLLTSPGDEVIIEGTGHSYDWELSGMAVISGVQPRVVEGDRGVFEPGCLAEALAPRPAIRSPATLVIVENTHNMSGGRVWPRAALDEVRRIGRECDAALHLDGARLFNAAVASGAPVAELAAGFDTVMVSLSKGLSAPMGSMLAASEQLIGEARRVRKMLGGGMRQVGVVAAAGRVALRAMVERLAEDHANARRLADGLTALEGIELAFGHVDTNIVVVDVGGCSRGADDIVERLGDGGVACLKTGPHYIRFVTHRGVDAKAIDAAVAVARELLRAG